MTTVVNVKPYKKEFSDYSDYLVKMDKDNTLLDITNTSSINWGDGPLPDGWEHAVDENGRRYYINNNTGYTQSTPPNLKPYVPQGWPGHEEGLKNIYINPDRAIDTTWSPKIGDNLGNSTIGVSYSSKYNDIIIGPPLAEIKEENLDVRVNRFCGDFLNGIDKWDNEKSDFNIKKAFSKCFSKHIMVLVNKLEYQDNDKYLKKAVDVAETMLEDIGTVKMYEAAKKRSTKGLVLPIGTDLTYITDTKQRGQPTLLQFKMPNRSALRETIKESFEYALKYLKENKDYIDEDSINSFTYNLCIHPSKVIMENKHLSNMTDFLDRISKLGNLDNLDGDIELIGSRPHYKEINATIISIFCFISTYNESFRLLAFKYLIKKTKHKNNNTFVENDLEQEEIAFQMSSLSDAFQKRPRTGTKTKSKKTKTQWILEQPIYDKIWNRLLKIQETYLKYLMDKLEKCKTDKHSSTSYFTVCFILYVYQSIDARIRRPDLRNHDEDLFDRIMTAISGMYFWYGDYVDDNKNSDGKITKTAYNNLLEKFGHKMDVEGYCINKPMKSFFDRFRFFFTSGQVNFIKKYVSKMDEMNVTYINKNLNEIMETFYSEENLEVGDNLIVNYRRLFEGDEAEKFYNIEFGTNKSNKVKVFPENFLKKRKKDFENMLKRWEDWSSKGRELIKKCPIYEKNIEQIFELVDENIQKYINSEFKTNTSDSYFTNANNELNKIEKIIEECSKYFKANNKQNLLEYLINKLEKCKKKFKAEKEEKEKIERERIERERLEKERVKLMKEQIKEEQERQRKERERQKREAEAKAKAERERQKREAEAKAKAERERQKREAEAKAKAEREERERRQQHQQQRQQQQGEAEAKAKAEAEAKTRMENDPCDIDLPEDKQSECPVKYIWLPMPDEEKKCKSRPDSIRKQRLVHPDKNKEECKSCATKEMQNAVNEHDCVTDSDYWKYRKSNPYKSYVKWKSEQENEDENNGLQEEIKILRQEIITLQQEIITLEQEVNTIEDKLGRANIHPNERRVLINQKIEKQQLMQEKQQLIQEKQEQIEDGGVIHVPSPPRRGGKSKKYNKSKKSKKQRKTKKSNISKKVKKSNISKKVKNNNKQTRKNRRKTIRRR